MKIVRVNRAVLCILGLVSGLPAMANQAGTSLVKAAPLNQAGTSLVKAAPLNQAGTSVVKAGVTASGVTTKATCEVDEVIGGVSCD